MEHTQALESMAAERYVLSEMSAEEGETFEEHYFGCLECAESVRDGRVLMDSGRAVTRRAAVPRSRTAWIAIAASAALLFAVGYQSFVISNLRAPMLMQQATLESGTRSAGERRVIAAGTPVVLSMYVDPQQQAVQSYRVTIRRADGTAVGRPLPVTADQVREPLSVELPAGLRPGSYEVVIEGISDRGNAVAVAKYPFIAR